ncbi:MAG: LacI family DNA-binding transcriptional regulator [Bacteroidetes bacterium]|nr:LacI family DNA-binding transcriptional regulator [Bacteroidota bacterium]
MVSMVLNDKGTENGINEDTQKRVWAKAKELDYKPNMMARSLRMGRSNTIGLIVADISNSFYARMCRAVEDAASKAGYHVLFGSSDENASKERSLIQMLRDRQVDGLIISTTLSNNEDIQALKNEKFPSS